MSEGLFPSRVHGTVNVARACLASGVRRLVHTSTADVFGFDPEGGEVDEEHAFNFDGLGYHYGESKLAAAQALRGMVAEGLDAVLVHPGSVIGPFDHTLQFGRLLFELLRRELSGCPAGGNSFCHVEVQASPWGSPPVQKGLLAGRVTSNFGSDLTGRCFAPWGSAFKPNTDYMREAPSPVTVERLHATGARLVAHDPEAMEEAKRLLGDRVEFRKGKYDVLAGADALLKRERWAEL